MQYESDFKELRRRIIFLVICFIAAFIFFYLNSPTLMDFIVQKGSDVGYSFVYISPAEVLGEQIKIAAIASFIVLLPLIVLEVALFVGPGVEAGISGIIIPSIFAIIMFATGVIFSYFVLMPFILNTLHDLGINSNITAQVSIANYISLYLTLLISLGFVFELPLASLGLAKFGVINSNFMRKGRKPAIVIALIVAALITPPDVFSQIVVAIPIIILYEFSIVLCKLVERKDKKCLDLDGSELQKSS